jgi:hypothetical protein
VKLSWSTGSITDWQVPKGRRDGLPRARPPLGHADYCARKALPTLFELTIRSDTPLMRRNFAMAVVVSCAVLLSAFGGSTSSKLPAGLRGKTASAIVKQANSAVYKAGSTSLALVESYQTYSGYAALETSSKYAAGTIHSFTGIGKFVQIGPKIYIMGDSQQLIRTFGSTAAKVKPYVNKWINIPRSSKHYKSASTGNLLPASIAQQAPIGPFSIGGVHKIAGVSVLEIIGRLNPQGSGVSGNAYMFVSLKAPYYPLYIVQSAKINGQTLTVTIKLAKFGGAFTVKAPAHFITSTSTKLG